MALGKIKQIDLRSAWKNEASDFTNWLAQEDNLSMLGDELGIDLQFLSTEAKVGTFSVDIIAKVENTERKVIIENQLEMTDHDHLGKLLTYASGADADIIIWLVKGVRDEHRQAIDWLNEHTDDKLNFFIIKMELLQIGDSLFAPKFQIISQPNDWAKAIRESGLPELSETELAQLEFWRRFKEYSINKGTKLRFQKASYRNWYSISIGSSKAHLSLVVSASGNFVRTELYIPDSKETFGELYKERESIERELGQKLEWRELPDKKASSIRIEKDADIDNTMKWENAFEWLKQQAETFNNIFGKYLKK